MSQTRRRSVRNVADAKKLEFAREQRRAPTWSEERVWQRLRRGALGARFRRQHPIGEYVLDFYCAQAHLAVEIDGPTHEDQAEYDQQRDAWLADRGIRVLRVSDGEVRENLGAVLEKVRSALTAASPPLPPSPWSPFAPCGGFGRRAGEGGND